MNAILDIGCGKGLKTTIFCEDYTNAQVMGLDISEVGVKYASNKYKDIQKLTFVASDVCSYIEENNNKYDLACDFELLEHIENWENIARKMTEISEQYIMISSPVCRMKSYEVKHGHYRNFNEENWRILLKIVGLPHLKRITQDFHFVHLSQGVCIRFLEWEMRVK